jgi:hypothetical protein
MSHLALRLCHHFHAVVHGVQSVLAERQVRACKKRPRFSQLRSRSCFSYVCPKPGLVNVRVGV